MKEKTSVIVTTANEFVNVKDIKDIFLYTKDGYIFCFLRIYPFNLDLLSDEERRIITNRLAADFDSDRKDWVYQAFPREVDIDGYKTFLRSRRAEEMESLGKKKIIDDQIIRANEISMNGENYEHQHFFKIWDRIDEQNNKVTIEMELKDRINGFKTRYEEAQIKCEILNEREIIKLCNLFSNNQFIDVSEKNILQPEVPLLSP